MEGLWKSENIIIFDLDMLYQEKILGTHWLKGQKNL